LNVARLNTYKSKLILFPRRENKPKKGLINDATAEQLKSAEATKQVTGFTLPIVRKEHAVEFAAITEEDKKKKIFHTLRTVRTNTRYRGRREKKANEKKAKE
jgi:large subunit ribosomal protein L13e